MRRQSLRVVNNHNIRTVFFQTEPNSFRTETEFFSKTETKLVTIPHIPTSGVNHTDQELDSGVNHTDQELDRVP